VQNLADIQGFDQLVAKLNQLGNSRTTKSSLTKVMRKVAKPLVQAAKSKAPVGSRDHKRYVKGQGGFGTVIVIKRGNLKRAIGIRNNRKNQDAELFVGPRLGGKNDGYYAHMVEYGTKNTPAQPFMRPAYDSTASQVTALAAKEAALVIQKEIDRLSR
jgi:HK97 gp10 family phage protein